MKIQFKYTSLLFITSYNSHQISTITQLHLKQIYTYHVVVLAGKYVNLKIQSAK